MKKEKSKDPNKKSKKWLKIVLLVLAAFAILGACLGDNEEKETPKEEVKQEEVQKEEPEEEVDVNGWTEKDKINFRVITETISDEFLTDYKTPWSNEEWTFAKFDDEGKVIVTTDYTLKDTSVKQSVMCVFTYNAEDETYKGHFLSVGDMIFLDDGTCDEFFQNLQDIMNSTNE